MRGLLDILIFAIPAGAVFVAVLLGNFLRKKGWKVNPWYAVLGMVVPGATIIGGIAVDLFPVVIAGMILVIPLMAALFLSGGEQQPKNQEDTSHREGQ